MTSRALGLRQSEGLMKGYRSALTKGSCLKLEHSNLFTVTKLLYKRLFNKPWFPLPHRRSTKVSYYYCPTYYEISITGCQNPDTNHKE